MVQRWYRRLPPNSIGLFSDLSQDFIKQFISGNVHKKSSASLMSIVQGANESLMDYLNRFIKEASKVPDLDDKVAMIALQQRTKDEFFKMSLAKRPPENMLQLQSRAEKYIQVEESMKKMVVNNELVGSKKRKIDQEYDVKDKYLRVNKEADLNMKKGRPGQKFTEYDRLNVPRIQILMEIERDKDVPNSSKNSKKAYAREVMHIIAEALKRDKTGVTMAFDDFDLKGMNFPHDDPLVITPIIGNNPVKRVLVDNGASIDILRPNTFIRMGYNDSQLTPTDMPIYGFAGVECLVEGKIKLPLTMGRSQDRPHRC
ncbi:uncharacterized protein LOC141706224 [Apium graveolens]|uniref:uncharacterized protein LOC141661260 n=1 Tax=Apium graveolens TaxID=4045 RepID=UPI003D79855F